MCFFYRTGCYWTPRTTNARLNGQRRKRQGEKASICVQNEATIYYKKSLGKMFIKFDASFILQACSLLSDTPFVYAQMETSKFLSWTSAVFIVAIKFLFLDCSLYKNSKVLSRPGVIISKPASRWCQI